MMRETIYINGKDIRDFGAEGQRDYTIGGTQVTNEYFQGRNRTSYVVLASFFGMKTINSRLFFLRKHAMRHYLTKVVWMRFCLESRRYICRMASTIPAS